MRTLLVSLLAVLALGATLVAAQETKSPIYTEPLAGGGWVTHFGKHMRVFYDANGKELGSLSETPAECMGPYLTDEEARAKMSEIREPYMATDLIDLPIYNEKYDERIGTIRNIVLQQERPGLDGGEPQGYVVGIGGVLGWFETLVLVPERDLHFGAARKIENQWDYNIDDAGTFYLTAEDLKNFPHYHAPSWDFDFERNMALVLLVLLSLAILALFITFGGTCVLLLMAIAKAIWGKLPRLRRRAPA